MEHEKTLVILKRGIRLDSLIKRINRQSGFIFSYNPRKIKTDLVVDLMPGTYSLNEVLTKIRKKAGLDYTIVQDHVILKPHKALPTPSVENPVAQKSESLGEPRAANVVNQEQAVRSDTAIAHQSDTTGLLRPSSKKTAGDSIHVEVKKNDLSTSVTPPVDSLRDKHAAQKTKPVVKPSKRALPEAMIGLSADETLYAGLVAQVGLPVAHVVASYKTDFSIALLSYGLGSSFGVGNTRINLFFTTGSLTRNFTWATKPAYDSASHGDSTHTYVIEARSRVLRGGVLVGKKIGTFNLQAGIVFNTMSTNYLVNGSPASIGFVGAGADKQIHTLQAPYWLNNSYSGTTSSNQKNWIGVQVNLIYRINFSKRK